MSRHRPQHRAIHAATCLTSHAVKEVQAVRAEETDLQLPVRSDPQAVAGAAEVATEKEKYKNMVVISQGESEQKHQ